MMAGLAHAVVTLSLVSPKNGNPRHLLVEMAIKSPRRSAPIPRPIRLPRRANQLVNRVVQKASFRSPDFIGFFAPISEIRDGPLPTVCELLDSLLSAFLSGEEFWVQSRLISGSCHLLNHCEYQLLVAAIQAGRISADYAEEADLRFVGFQTWLIGEIFRIGSK